MNQEIVNDNYYYNAVIDNNILQTGNHIPIPLVYNETEAQTIIQHPKDFYLSVVRFQIPGNLIPLFFNVGFNGGDVNKTYRSITLTYSLSVQHVFLQYVPQDLTIPIPSQPITQYNIQYYAMRSYQQIADEINVAFSTAFIALGLPVLVPALVVPFISYDSISQLFSINVDQRLPGLGFKMFMNTDLYQLFLPTFNSILNGYDSIDGRDVEILIKDNHNNSFTMNSVDYYRITQESRSINNINQFRSLILTINNVPIRYESIPNSSQSGSVQSNFLPILTDFIPALSNTANESQTQIVYYPTAEYRLVDLVGDTPIKTIEIRGFWGDKYENLYPIMIPAHEKASIKILFRNRKLYNMDKKKV